MGLSPWVKMMGTVVKQTPWEVASVEKAAAASCFLSHLSPPLPNSRSLAEKPGRLWRHRESLPPDLFVSLAVERFGNIWERTLQQLINDTARKNDKSTMSSVSILHHKYTDRRKGWWRGVQWGLCPRDLEKMQLESLPELSLLPGCSRARCDPWQE